MANLGALWPGYRLIANLLRNSEIAHRYPVYSIPQNHLFNAVEFEAESEEWLSVRCVSSQLKHPP